MPDFLILWSRAERGEFMTDWLFSDFFGYVSSFFESIFILIDNYLKPYLFRYRVLVGLGLHVIITVLHQISVEVIWPDPTSR